MRLKTNICKTAKLTVELIQEMNISTTSLKQSEKKPSAKK